MDWKRIGPILGLGAVLAGAAAALVRPRHTPLILTGIVTTNDVIVGPQVAGRVDRLLVREGDTVGCDQLLAVIEPAELEADRAFYSHSAEGYASQVKQNAAALRYQERQTTNQIRQAEANLAAARAQRAEAVATLEDARLTYQRLDTLARYGASPEQERDHARAAEAQKVKADVRLGYTEVRAPLAGIVDVRAARTGEFLNPGQAIVTLIDPDDLWVRADVEETYIDRVRLGDRITVRLPSGAERVGTVIFRGVDAGFATQRDVSRTKRDIRTFEVRLRVDNRDRQLAVGMTAYVLLPVPH